MEREPIKQPTEAERLFLKTYGIPLSWARQLSQYDNDAGKHWRGVLDFLSTPKEEVIYDRSKIKSKPKP